MATQRNAELGRTNQTYHQLPCCIPWPSADEGRRDYSAYQVGLYKAALRGDWDVASQIQQGHPNCFKEEISRNKDTALHIAAAGGRSNFVKQLLLQHVKFTPELLMLRNKTGNTAFCLAAASGDVEIVQEMLKLNPHLPNIPGSLNLRPILMAALLGHRKVVTHLLPCFHLLSKDERIDLLINTINTDLYDVALKILAKDVNLAIARNGDGLSALYVLAQKTHKPNTSLNSGRQRCNIPFISNLWKEKKRDHTEFELVERLWEIVIKQPSSVISGILSSPLPRLLFAAIEMGNYEFIATLMRKYPDLMWEIDEEHRTIFHAAIQYRQEKIFRHIRQLDGINHLLTAYKHPRNGNNILHLAATLPPLERLNVVSGAALQMQRELLWFQVVEEVVRREYSDLKNHPNSSNDDNETPRVLFSREHKGLREEGEKWMRDTATSCMVVATLVAAVVFQAIFQPPSDKNKSMFWMFVVSDASSLLASTASILTFLAILTSRYAEDDFLISLPLKLMVGISLLFFSIMSMLIAFTVTIAIVFPHPLVWFSIAILAWFTGTFYIWQQFPLLVDVHRSTFGSNYLFFPRDDLFRD